MSEVLTIEQWRRLSPEERRRRNAALIDLLRSWREEDEEEQRETFEILRRALGAERNSYRKLF